MTYPTSKLRSLFVALAALVLTVGVVAAGGPSDEGLQGLDRAAEVTGKTVPVKVGQAPSEDPVVEETVPGRGCDHDDEGTPGEPREVRLGGGAWRDPGRLGQPRRLRAIDRPERHGQAGSHGRAADGGRHGRHREDQEGEAGARARPRRHSLADQPAPPGGAGDAPGPTRRAGAMGTGSSMLAATARAPRRSDVPGSVRVAAPDHRDRVLELELRDRQVLRQVRPVDVGDRPRHVTPRGGRRQAPRRLRPAAAWR